MSLRILYLNLRTLVFLVYIAGLVQFTQAQDKPDTTAVDIQTYFKQVRDYQNQDNLEAALKAIEKATKLAEENEDEKGLVDCYHKYAILFLKLGNKENTDFYWNRANSILKNIAYPYGTALQEYIEALLLYEDEKNFLALFKLKSAKKRSNNRNLWNNALLIEGNINLKIEKFEDASTNFNSIVVNEDIYEKQYLSTKAYLGLAELYFKQEDFEESAKNSIEALKLASANGFSLEVVEANKLLTVTYEQLGQFDTSLEYLKSLKNIQDSIYTIEKVKAVAKSSDKTLIEFSTKEVERLEAEITELRDSKNRSDITSVLASAFLTIISILAISLYRNNQIKLKTNELLLTKNNELEAARDAAVMAMEAKTNFLSTVSHELRTPLYAVTGLTNLLLEENPTKAQQEHLKSLKFSGDYLLNFINDILQINKIDADKLEALNIEFSLKKTLKEVVNSLQQSAKNNNTELILRYDDDIPVALMSDPIKISQILINLVGNAIKFTKDGKVTVITKLISKQDEDVTIHFEIQDTGIGISKENQENIFDSFEQGSIQINREYGGTGLGLTIVKSLLGLFGSRINLKSEIDKGSSFFFDLDIKSKDGILDDMAFEITQREFNFKGLHLLIVEDNKINQVITKKMLSKKEMTSDIANNGTEAIDLTQENTYDAILMDIHMPGISGEEATIEIRKFNKEIPIIALTAISLDDSLESFYAAGCNDVVTKPFKPEVFYQKIGENIFNKKVDGPNLEA